MESCLEDALTELFTSSCANDSIKLQEAVSIATFAAVCFKEEQGAEYTLRLLQALTEEGLTTLLDNPPSPSLTPHTPPHKFWLITERLTSPTTHITLRPLHSLHTTLTHVTSSLSHCTLTALGPEEASQLQEAVCDHVTRVMFSRVPADEASTVEGLVESIARVYVIRSTRGDAGVSNVVIDGQSRSEQVLTTLVRAGIKLTHQTYMDRVGEEVMSDECTVAADGGFILKSVSTLTDSLLLLATIAKTTASVEELFVKTTLSLFNHCLEQIVQKQKFFPDDLSLKSMWVVFASALHIESVFTELTTKLEFQRHDYTEQLRHNLVDCCNKMRERIDCYHIQLCCTSLLQDRDSNNWLSSQPFYEDERCSFSIQMWHYHMHALKYDLCTLLPSSRRPISQSILHEVLSSTLSFLSARYSQLTPSCKRCQQARCDILSILFTVSDLLPGPHPTAIRQSCTTLLHTLSLTLSPLDQLKDHLVHTLSVEGPPPLNTAPKDWRPFLRTCGISSTDSKYGHGCTDRESTEVVSSVEAGVSPTFHSYPDDRSSWPNLLQMLCDNVSLAVKLCRCEGVRAHLVRVLVHSYHSPHTLGRVYLAFKESREESGRRDKTSEQDYGGGVDGFLQDATRHVVAVLQEYVLLGVAKLHLESTDKAGELEDLLSGLVEEVSRLPSPLLHLIRMLADADKDRQLPLGAQITKVLAQILGAYLDTLIPRLNKPLVSMVTTYSALLAQSITGLPRQPSPRMLDVFSQLNELFTLELGVVSDPVGVVSLAEHEIAVEVMRKDENVLQSLKVVCSHLTPSQHSPPSRSSDAPPSSHPPPSFNPLTVHNTVGGASIASLVEKAAALNWKELFEMTVLTRSHVAGLVARRWEFQESSRSLLRDAEAEQVREINCLLQDESSV